MGSVRLSVRWVRPVTTPATMPSYKLIYFESKGRAELTRCMFAYGDIQYTDERIPKAEWPEKKKSLPFSQLPILMVDDKPLPQSKAIARYVAKEVGLVPEDNLQAAYCDAMVDTLDDIMAGWIKIMMHPTKSEEEKNKEFTEVYLPNTLQPFLVKLEKRLSEKVWFLGDKMSWADVALGITFGNPKVKTPELIKNFPAVCNHSDKVAAIPKIKAWI